MSGQGVLIRPATARDRDELQLLWREVEALHAELLPAMFCLPLELEHGGRRIESVLADPSQTILVAAREEPHPELAGLVHVALYDTPSEPTLVSTRRGYIEDLVVAEPFRRVGVGRALMGAAERWARQHGARQLVLTVWSGNEGAESFYRELGYRELSRVLSRDI